MHTRLDDDLVRDTRELVERHYRKLQFFVEHQKTLKSSAS